MLVNTKGIVIGRRNIGDNNCFLDILTEDYGVIEVTAHGVRRVTSKNAGGTSLFCYSTFCLNKSGFKYTINSLTSNYNFYNIAKNIESLALAVYFAELVKYTSASEENESEVLRLLLVTLFHIEKNKLNLAQIKAVFEFRLASLIGFLPSLEACAECVKYSDEFMYFSFEDASIWCERCFKTTGINDYFKLSESLLHTMRFAVYTDIDKVCSFKVLGATLDEFSLVAEKYILWHLGRNFKSLDYYKGLF